MKALRKKKIKERIIEKLIESQIGSLDKSITRRKKNVIEFGLNLLKNTIFFFKKFLGQT